MYASALRRELAERNRAYALGRAHVESYGGDPVIVYRPQGVSHGNFYAPAYADILQRPAWAKRFNKSHAQSRALPAPESGRKWRELDSCMSSDALLMNIFCTPEVHRSSAVRRMLGIESSELPEFGWKARVPLNSGLSDRTEVDMRWGDLLVEAKLTETGFQTRKADAVEAYRDFNAVFDRERLPRILLRTARRRTALEFPEEFTQEWEQCRQDAEPMARAHHAEIVARAERPEHYGPAYGHYQLIRNVLAAYAHGCRFCVVHDARRPDLREAWFQVMAAVHHADMRTRCAALTWQELAAAVPGELREFLQVKYGIDPAGASPLRI